MERDLYLICSDQFRPDREGKCESKGDGKEKETAHKMFHSNVGVPLNRCLSHIEYQQQKHHRINNRNRTTLINDSFLFSVAILIEHELKCLFL